jgi:hypothetical protein
MQPVRAPSTRTEVLRMFSRSIVCTNCGADNKFIVQGVVLDVDEVCCSRCAEPMGRWADLLKSASARRPSDEGRHDSSDRSF